MHPAFSVILFTTLSGGGYALLALMGLLGPLGFLPVTPNLGLMGLGTGLVAVGLGLVSSVFHLGRPERAWRAFSQWRSSWLSREGVLSLATFAPALVFAAGWLLAGRAWFWAGFALAICALATILTTAMIYASLKPIRRWRHPLTLPGYLLLGAASGAVWLALILRLAGNASGPVEALAAGLAFAAGFVKYCYWRGIDRETKVSSAESATGLGAIGKVGLLSSPHSEENYLLKEMGYSVARKHAEPLRRISLIMIVLLPVALIGAANFLAGVLAAIALIAAVLVNFLGTVTERWLFFAEARHTVILYYGAAAA
jgi:sulfite dehydrogenase (quinone) subunit SoeC